jgi:indolepyruvate ferredoxin oxidoreductase alpha subunit
MDPAVRKSQPSAVITILDTCIGCEKCTGAFECPALSMDRENNVAVVDQDRCIGCGTCIPVCPVNAIVAEKRP